jgi:hypothetical protein
VLRESADQRVLVWCLHEDEVGLRGDDRVADVLEWPGEFGAGPQGAGADLGGVAGVASAASAPAWASVPTENGARILRRVVMMPGSAMR